MPEASGSEVADESDYSIFENKTGLAEDMKFLASMPELCDVTFLVGETKEPICAVKAVLAARSRVFQKMFYQAPSPQRKKEPPPKENKIRLFLKRSSEPLLNLQNAAQQPNQHQTVIIEEFEPDVFRQLIEYIHTGCVTLQPRTLLGLMNAADYYGLEQLRKACTGFVQCCITVDTVCALLASAERYIQYKCTKSLVHKVFEFVDEHGNEVLNLGSFTLLPQHVVRLILAREELRADEFTKFQAALMWSKKYCDSNQNQDLKDVIGNFLEYIQFHKIPANVLMREVHPLDLVPSRIIVNALAYQADPASVDPGHLSPHRVKHQDRSLSVQSSLQDQFGSNTSLSSTGSDEGSDEKQHSGKYGIAEQEIREHERWPKHRSSEEEDIQRLIEQRNQYQSMRQEDTLQRQHDEQLIRKQEEELRRQEMQEEFERRQKELQKKKKQEEELRKQKEQEKLKKQQEQEEPKKQQKQDEPKKQQKQEELKKQQEQEKPKKQQKQDEPKKQQKQEEPKKQQEQEDLKKQQEQEEPKKQQEQEEPKKQQEQEEPKKQQEQEDLKKQQEQELKKAVKEVEDVTKKQKEEEINRQSLEEKKQKEELKKQKEVKKEEASKEGKQDADLEKKQEEEKEKKEQQLEVQKEDDEKQKHREDKQELQQPEESQSKEKIEEENESEEPSLSNQEKSQQQLEEEERIRGEQELLKQQKEKEQRRIREERKLQLQLQELKTQWPSEELTIYKQEEALQRQIENLRYEEQWESRQFQQMQLYFEGRKPEAEKKPEKRQTTERKKTEKRKDERVEIRVHGAESPKQEDPAVTGFYIKLVVRQEGRANLVWLFKTHKF
ncbi:golgin subfamily A member 6-like protein 6 isoform X2 [Bombus terrestris]|uniref:Golgin subfamily A member 6-like protein 6 isoform X2 n=1 Tax=Bombus terrestris TaxID=30195 RepID=A0A9C6SIA3_BOMTE|nr:golgin subfamily A member 6-like protein 6 isoform X2 [Bombus terrestris]